MCVNNQIFSRINIDERVLINYIYYA